MRMHSIAFLVAAASLSSLSAQALECHHESFLPQNPDAVYVADGSTVVDTRTGLMWKRCAEGQTWTGADCEGDVNTYTWQQALQAAAASSHGGHQDWRLPNAKELLSLIERCRINPAINTNLFPSTPSESFWSGSPSGRFAGRAWRVFFHNGVATDATFNTEALAARLVRDD